MSAALIGTRKHVMNDRKLPAGWVTTTLGEAFKWASGGTPKRDRAEYYGGDIPWAIIGDLNDGIVVDTANTITQLGLDASSARIVPAGSVLLAMYGSIGKLGIAGIDLSTNQAIAFTQTGLVCNKYLFWYLFAKRNDLLSLGRGDTQSNISQTVIKGFPFLLAPLPEQHRIVAAIEQHLTRLDASVTALQRVQANLQRYRASVLKTACEGKLVPTEAALARAEGRDYEHADRLVARILVERRARWAAQPKRRGRYKEPAPPDTSALPELPEGWAWSKLDQLITMLMNGYPKRPQGIGGTPILRISALRPMAVDLEDVRWVENAEHLARFLIHSGDLLFTRYNGNRSLVGVCGVVPNLKRDILHPDKLIRARLERRVYCPNLYR